MDCILGSQYMPSIEYFAHWLYHGTISLEAHEHYQKRSWRNKTCILGADAPQALTVPLQKGKHQQMKITDVLIAYDEDWPTLHLRSIRTAYGKTAFAQEVLAGFEPILANQHTTLWSLNQSCLTYVTLLLKGQWPYQITTEYKTSEDSKTFDLRSGIPCGTSVFLEKKFPEYGQVLRIHKTHLPNLSILDALCHLGPQTYDYLVGYAQQLYKKS